MCYTGIRSIADGLAIAALPCGSVFGCPHRTIHFSGDEFLFFKSNCSQPCFDPGRDCVPVHSVEGGQDFRVRPAGSIFASHGNEPAIPISGIPQRTHDIQVRTDPIHPVGRYADRAFESERDKSSATISDLHVISVRVRITNCPIDTITGCINHSEFPNRNEEAISEGHTRQRIQQSVFWD